MRYKPVISVERDLIAGFAGLSALIPSIFLDNKRDEWNKKVKTSSEKDM